jgi:hypothetical protein
MAPVRVRQVPRCIARRESGPRCAALIALMALILLGLLFAQPRTMFDGGFLVARHFEASPRF